MTWRRCCAPSARPWRRPGWWWPTRPGPGWPGRSSTVSARPGTAAERLAYVSCDPATLARDIGLLTERGWVLDGLRAFDAFPMTHHVECVAVLARPGVLGQARSGQEPGCAGPEAGVPLT